ncbi:hypothetical protein FRB90_003949, partial [Tulasnella sp. 427]
AFPNFFDIDRVVERIGIPEGIRACLWEHYNLQNQLKRKRPQEKDEGMPLFILENGEKLGNPIRIPNKPTNIVAPSLPVDASSFEVEGEEDDTLCNWTIHHLYSALATYVAEKPMASR